MHVRNETCGLRGCSNEQKRQETQSRLCLPIVLKKRNGKTGMMPNQQAHMPSGFSGLNLVTSFPYSNPNY